MSDKPKLQAVALAELPVDEHELLTAYRAMSDETRDDTLKFALFCASRWPRPAPRQPLRLVTGGRQ